MNLVIPRLLRRPMRPWAEEELPQQPASTVVEDETAYPTRAQSVPWAPTLAADEDAGADLKNFGLDDEPAPRMISEARTWPSRPSTDDDGFVLTLGVDEEHGFRASRQDVSWLAPTAVLDDEIGAPLANFGLDDDMPWPARAQCVAWTPALFLDEDPVSNPFAGTVVSAGLIHVHGAAAAVVHVFGPGAAVVHVHGMAAAAFAV